VILHTGFFWILLAGLVYGAIHSAFASHMVKSWVTNQFCIETPKMYRLVYVMQSFFFTIIYIGLIFLFPDHSLYLIFSPWRYLFMLIEVAAAVCAFLSLLQTGIWSFLGLESFIRTENASQPAKLNTAGFYRIVRHPLYLFSLIVIWLFPFMTWNILAFNIGATAYLIIGSLFEERKLAQDFGPEYLEYQKRVPSFLPRLLRKLN
jgi:protein-S-isoprenylcysteine O-methyltransferase Ste14